MTNPIKIISKKEFLKKNKKLNQEEVWDDISESWKKYRQGKIPIVEEFLRKANSDFKKSENSKFAQELKIIDLGCGSGRNMIKNYGIEYFGVDFSELQLKNAGDYTKDNKIRAHLFKSEIDKLDKKIFKNGVFDYGLFIATLHCLETKKQRENALKEFHRVLKKGAEAIITVWNSKDKRFSGLKKDIYMSWKNNNKIYMRYYYLYEKQELIDLLRKSGFKILEIYKEKDNDRFSKKNWIIRVKK